jgi:hypothetical protein
MTLVVTLASERVHQLLHSLGGAVEAVACIDVFDLDDTAFAPAYCVDRMHTKAAITNEPRHN